MARWHIITGEYPPQPGGVSDYTRLVARELAGAGDTVEVWTSQSSGSQASDDGIKVYRLPGRFGPHALAKLDRVIGTGNEGRVLIQYVPHAFGCRAMNLAFCLWLFARRRLDITVMFHEVAFPNKVRQPLRHNLLAAVTRFMAALVAHSARRIFISCPAWEPMLRRLVGNSIPVVWLPVPSNIMDISDPDKAKAVRERYAPEGFLVGHFGTYAHKIRNTLQTALPELLRAPSVRVILLGRGSDLFRDSLAARHPALATRLHAVGDLPADLLSHHLSACDVVIQPYPDGISTRRTSVMAALSHGRAIVATKGALTEPFWLTNGAVTIVPDNPLDLVRAAENLLGDQSARERLGLAARKLYRDHFDVRHTIRALKS